MKLTMLGTGNALVTECYNTCFVLSDEYGHFLVDGGGGNTVLSQLKKAGIDLMDVHEIFVTHKHVDHIMGIVWVIRIICQNMKKGTYQGEANIYAHDEVIGLLKDMAFKLLNKKETQYIGDRLHLIEVKDGEERTILNKKVSFFDIGSTKAKQFGFQMIYDGGKVLTCCGDEPYNECEEKYAKGSDWMFHEAFCLYGQRDIFNPYEKHHSTVKDASELAENLGVKNLLLDLLAEVIRDGSGEHALREVADFGGRNERIELRTVRGGLLYGAEGREYYHGNLFIPDDLDVIEM